MDAGLGMAAAMGVRFLDGSGAEVEPTARGLGKIARIDASVVPGEMDGLKILIASDVKNPACGETGSAQVFGRQKGASRQDIAEIDEWIVRFCGLVREATGKDLLHTPGTGAAGGMAIPLLAFFGADIVPGIDLILDAAGFNEKIRGANMVITGEGCWMAKAWKGKCLSGSPAALKKRGSRSSRWWAILGRITRGHMKKGSQRSFRQIRRPFPSRLQSKPARKTLRCWRIHSLLLRRCGRRGR